jgi:hypothetical protein
MDEPVCVALIPAGFVIERLEKPTPTDEVVQACPDIQEAQVVAYFLASGMRQLAGTKTRYRRAHAAPLADSFPDAWSTSQGQSKRGLPRSLVASPFQESDLVAN